MKVGAVIVAKTLLPQKKKKMKILYKVKDIKTAIAELKAQNQAIGFVPQ